MNGKFRFVDVSASTAREQQLWPSIVVPKKAIDSEVQRLADIALPATGRRACAVDQIGRAHV